MKITEIITEEVRTASATTAEGHTGREAYEAAGARLGFQPVSDDDLILLSEDLSEIFEAQARDAEDPTMLAAVLFSGLRRTELALEQLEGTRPLDLRRGEPQTTRLQLLAASSTPWLSLAAGRAA